MQHDKGRNHCLSGVQSMYLNFSSVWVACTANSSQNCRFPIPCIPFFFSLNLGCWHKVNVFFVVVVTVVFSPCLACSGEVVVGRANALSIRNWNGMSEGWLEAKMKYISLGSRGAWESPVILDSLFFLISWAHPYLDRPPLAGQWSGLRPVLGYRYPSILTSIAGEQTCRGATVSQPSGPFASCSWNIAHMFQEEPAWRGDHTKLPVVRSCSRWKWRPLALRCQLWSASCGVPQCHSLPNCWAPCLASRVSWCQRLDLSSGWKYAPLDWQRISSMFCFPCQRQSVRNMVGVSIFLGAFPDREMQHMAAGPEELCGLCEPCSCGERCQV